MSEWAGLVLSPRDDKLIACCADAPRSPRLNREDILALLQSAGYGDWIINDSALNELASRWNSNDDSFELTIAERQDGSVEFDVPSNGMFAYANIFPARGGTPVVAADVIAALRDQGVVHGIDEAAIMEACKQNKPIQVQAAVGTPPRNGEDARFEPLIDGTRNRAPRANDKGLIDFRDLGAIPMVEANQPLMRRIPASLGIDGCTVRGQALLSNPGQNVPFEDNLTGACVAAHDSNLLIAIFKGQPVLRGNGVSVEPVLHTNGVNMTTGHVDFDGTVVIDGEVLPGMKVHSTGDIIVHNTVDGAELDAGGNIEIHGGIIAHARVRAKGSISAKFVENAHLFSGTVISVDDAVLQSDLEALNHIQVGVKSPQRGLLAGGSARAMMRIDAPIIGSEHSGLTSLMVGVNPQLEDDYQSLLQRISKQQTEEDNLQKLISHLTAHGDKNNMLERAQATWEKAAQNWAVLLGEKEELENQMALIKEARICMSVGVDGPIEIAFGRTSLHFREKASAGAFMIREGQIVLTDPRGELMRIR